MYLKIFEYSLFLGAQLALNIALNAIINRVKSYKTVMEINYFQKFLFI